MSGNVSLVLYDVTTLCFAAEREDEADRARSDASIRRSPWRC
jgi:hypothetical protein